MNKFTAPVLGLFCMVSAFAAADRDKRDERGVVSIEYLVLGAALIVLIGVLSTAEPVQTALKTAFSGLFTKAGA